MKNKKILVGLIAITLIAGVSTINAENIIDITINQQHEKTGLELGTNSYARGESSIATGKNSVAIGSGAVATGDNLTGEKIKGMLAENKSKLEEIDAKKNKIKNLSDDINNLKIREHDVIEAGIRVREIQKSKANAKNVWIQAEKDWEAKKDGSQAALNSYQEKIDDLNSRLTGVKNLKNSNISTPEGLTAAATELKTIVEKGTKMDLSVDFYKDYIDNYYKSLGDLREKNKIYSYIGWDNIKIKDLIKENFLKADMQDIVIQYNNFQDSNSYSSYSSSSASDSYSYGNCDNSSNSYSSSSSTASYYSSLGEYGKDRNGIYRVNGSRTQKQEYNGVKYQTDWNIKGDICDQVTFDKWNAVKEGWKAQIKDANKRSGSEIFGKFDTLTGGKSTILFNMVTEMKFELVDLDYQICHYQWQYERTRNNKWLDKKREALEKRQQKLNTNEQTIKNKYKELFHKDLSDTAKLFNTIGQDLKKEFKEKEIDSIEQKNKITTDKLTSDLERELGINKNAIQNYENEIKSLREKADQAKKNYEGLNPSVKDLILSKEYESVAKELENKASQLKTETEALEELKKNLKLNDLKNIGENAIAYGTNALVTGKNSIGIGTNVLITGEDAIGIGRENIVSALGSVAIGTNNKILGNNTFVLGTNIVSNAENAVILGKDSVGENNTLSVGSTGNERKIIHVGNPTQNTDAVNLQYMKEYVSNIDVTNQISSKADKSDLNKKADKDAGNIEISKWQTKLGDGKNEAGNTGLVTGSTLNKALEGKADKTYVDGELNKKADKSDITNLTNNITNKANISLNNIDESGKTVIKNLAKGSIKVANGTNTTVSEEKEGDTKVYKVNVSNETIKNAIKSDLENKADKSDLDKKADKDAGNIEISKWQTKLGDGKNEAGNTGLITGGTLNKALEGKADKTYVDGELNKKADKSDITNLTNNITNKANISLNNIDKAGETVIKNLAIGSVKVEAGVNTTVTTEDKDGSKIYKVNVSNETIKNAIKSDLNNKADKSDLDKKADKDAGNIEISKWQLKLGDGKNEAGNTGLVTGGTLNKALEGKADKTYVDGELNKKADKSDITNLTNNITNKANISLNNIDESGKTVIKNLAKGSIKVANGTNTTVSEEKEGDTKVYKVNVSNETIKNAIKSDLNNKADKSDLDKKADKDAGNIEISKWQIKLGNGKNEAGNTGLITGGTLNKALEDVKAGKADLSGEISVDNKTKGVTGDKIYYAINNMTTVLENRGQARYNVLDNKINETGAESAALAALKYDNEDSKLQLAAGVGHYNSKTAYALGLKYNMNNNASFHFGSTIGNGKTMLNGGFSIAIGSGHKKVNADAIKRMENMQNEINELKRQNQELMKAIEKMGHVLNIDKVKKDSFKDIPDGHWAKDAVEILHGNGIVEGYPDGEFKGDKPMTRYEYSQMLEKALAKA